MDCSAIKPHFWHLSFAHIYYAAIDLESSIHFTPALITVTDFGSGFIYIDHFNRPNVCNQFVASGKSNHWMEKQTATKIIYNKHNIPHWNIPQ